MINRLTTSIKQLEEYKQKIINQIEHLAKLTGTEPDYEQQMAFNIENKSGLPIDWEFVDEEYSLESGGKDMKTK